MATFTLKTSVQEINQFTSVPIVSYIVERGYRKTSFFLRRNYRWLFVILPFVFCSGLGIAQQNTNNQCQTSDAAAATYNSDWSNGQNDNATGFGAWSLSKTGSTSGFVIGSSTNNAGGANISNINTDGRAWGMYSSGGGLASAVRPFVTSLNIGHSLSCSMDNGSVNSGNVVGIGLRNSSGQNLMELMFWGGESAYKLSDASGTTSTGILYTGNGLDITITRTGLGTYTISILRKESGVTTSFTRNFFNPSGGQTPAQIRFFNSNAGSPTTNYTYFNNLQTCTAPDILYYHSFSSGAVSGSDYNTSPDVLATNLSVGSPQWTGVNGTGFCTGNNGLSVSVPNLGSTRTMTLKLDVASGYSLNLSGISFKQASTINNGSYGVKVNGTTYASSSSVLNACPGVTLSGSTPLLLSGTVTIDVYATNSGTSPFAMSIDDFTINGSLVSSVSTLSSLSLSAGSLSPTFSSATTSYTTSVGNSVSSVAITPTVTQSNAAVTVNGNPVTSGSASAPVSLSVGPNSIPVVVTAEDGTTTTTYTITVTRLAANTIYYHSFSSGAVSGSDYNTSPDVLATNLSVGSPQWTGVNGTGFCTGNNGLSVSVPNLGSTRTMTLKLDVASGYSLNLSGISFKQASTINNGSYGVKVNGTTYASSSSVLNACPGVTLSGSTPLLLSGTVTIDVYATNSGTSPFAMSIDDFTINGSLVSSVSTLSSLSLSAGSLSPTFSSATTSYTTSVGNSVSSVAVTPTVTQSNAAVTVNGNPVTSGSASTPVSLSVGPNSIPVVVTAEDGTTTTTYTITVTRLAASTVYYHSFSAGAVSGSDYNTSPDELATNLSVGSPQWTGVSGTGFCTGNNGLSVSVPNLGSTRTMTLKLDVASGYSLKLSGISFKQVSTINNGSYGVKVNGTTYASSSSVLNACPGVTLSGSTPLLLSGTVTIDVYATNSGTSPFAMSIDDFTINGSLVSSVSTLSSLSLSAGSLSPTFSSATTSYTTSVGNSVSSVAITPTVTQSNAAVTVNGNPVTSGSASTPVSLSVGPNSIPVVVTAEDGTTTTTYTITVTRLAANTIYYHSFSSGAVSGSDYNTSPDVLATNLSVGSPQWTGVNGTGFCTGNNGLSVSVPNLGSTRTMTLKLDVASGYSLNLSGISFKQASTINNGSYGVKVNGTTYASSSSVLNACPGVTLSGSTPLLLSGTVTIDVYATNSGTSPFGMSIDDFTINGSLDIGPKIDSVKVSTLKPCPASAITVTAKASGVYNVR